MRSVASPLLQRLLGAALLFGALLLGCGETDLNKPAYWIERLQGADRKTAIMRLGEMKAAEAVPVLIDVFKKGGSNRYELIAALTQIGDRRAIPVFVEVMQDTKDGKSARLAATTLREWGVKEHLDVYLRVAVGKDTPKEARMAALELVAKFPNPSIVEPLLPILTADPDVQPIVFTGLAAEALGLVRAEKAVDGLIECMWLDDHLHRNEVPRCRLALNRVGPVAVPALIKTLSRKNRKVEARARKLKYDKGGLIEAKMAELLGDMPDARAVEPLTKALLHFDKMSPAIQNDPNRQKAFVMSEVQKVISICNALAVIGDDRAVEAMLTIANDENSALEFKLAGVQQLGFLGSQKAVPGLVKLLKNEPHPRDPVSQGFRVQIALNLANVLDGRDAKIINNTEKMIKGIIETLEKYKADTKKEQEKAEAKFKTGFARDIKAYGVWQGQYKKVLAKLAALRACKTDVACWGKKLAKDTPEAVRMLAGYRLAQSRHARKAALAELVGYVGDEDLVFRNVILFGLDRLGDASIIGELRKHREKDAERAKKDRRLRGAVYTMDLMIAKLEHKKAK